jgi:hypothetical protein
MRWSTAELAVAWWLLGGRVLIMMVVRRAPAGVLLSQA